MIKFLSIICFIILIPLYTFSQSISYNDLLFIMNSNEIEKIDNLLVNKGFNIGKVGNSNDCDSFEWNYKNTEQRLNNVHMVQKMCDEYNNLVVVYSTTNPKNYQIIKNEILRLKYKKIGENTYGNMLNVGYQKGKYRFQFSKKDVEKINDVKYILTQYLIFLRVQKNN